MDWLGNLVGNFWFWAVGVPVLAVMGLEVTKRVIRHRERMAMIQQGIDPDRLRSAAAPLES